LNALQVRAGPHVVRHLHAHGLSPQDVRVVHPRYRLNVFTGRGPHLMRRDGSVCTPLGYLAAFATNAISRKAMGVWLERVILSDSRDRRVGGRHAATRSSGFLTKRLDTRGQACFTIAAPLARLTTNKSEKGTMVMTPRTSTAKAST